jgi:hypothetical protein
MKKIFIPIIIVLVGILGFLVYRVSKSSIDMQLISQNQPVGGNGYGVRDGIGAGNQNGPNDTKGSCNADSCLAINDLEYPVGDLSEEAKTALEKALDDEYKAYATYDVVIEKFGNVRPFIMIIRAEEQHISSLKGLFDKYGLLIPENPYLDEIDAPETLTDACSTGVEAEIENAELYRKDLLPNVVEYEDITLVFNNLMNASQEKHLPAFERCAE